MDAFMQKVSLNRTFLVQHTSEWLKAILGDKSKLPISAALSSNYRRTLTTWCRNTIERTVSTGVYALHMKF
jgi:hypothetical protein